MTASRTILIFKLWAAAVLAVIACQAMVPVQTPLQRETGSAFSAATLDVALVSGRRADVAQGEALPTPSMAGPSLEVRPLPAAAKVLPSERLRPDVRGPPPRDGAVRLPDLRGPPLA